MIFTVSDKNHSNKNNNSNNECSSNGNSYKKSKVLIRGKFECNTTGENPGKEVLSNLNRESMFLIDS